MKYRNLIWMLLFFILIAVCPRGEYSSFYPGIRQVRCSTKTNNWCFRITRTIVDLSHPIGRLSLQEANEACLSSMATIKDNMPGFSEAAKQALIIYQNQGLDAFEEKGMDLLKEAIAPINTAVNTIKTLPQYIGFTKEDTVRQLTETFLKEIAQELGADKIIISFMKGQGFYLDHTYSLGLSEQEYESYIRNIKDIHDYFFEVRNFTLVEKELEGLLLNGPRLLEELGISSVASYQGDLNVHRDAQGNYLSSEDWVQLLVVGRSEEGIRQRGTYTREDSERIEQLIKDRLDIYREIKELLFAEWHDFLTTQRYLRHNGGIDVFSWQRAMVIYSLFETIEEIRRQDEKSAEAQDYLIRILEDIPKANERMLDDLARFSTMMEAGLDYRLQDVTPVLLERFASFELVADMKGLEFNTDITDEEFMIHCDINQFALVIDNIISNAVKYTPEGSVTVNVAKNHGNIFEGICVVNRLVCEYLEIIVEDTGIGIPQDEISRIYHRGYRASNVGDIPGTGIGFNIASTIIRSSLRGQKIVESETGRGTKVTLRIPIGKVEYGR